MSIQVARLEDCKAAMQEGFERTAIFHPARTGSESISLERVTLRTGEESSPHAHRGTHTVVYTLEGSVRIFYGDELGSSVRVATGDSVYIPPDVIHYVVNSEPVPMVAIVARSPALHEVVEYPHLRALLAAGVPAP